MFFKLLTELAASIYYFALHVTGSGSFPAPLSAGRESELLEKSEKGDMEARNELIEHNLRLVAHIVKKYYTQNTDQDDLISIGTIGLIKAVSTFNSNKGIRLATYAARCIENEILMHFRSLKKSAQDIYLNEPVKMDKEGNSISIIDVVADDIDIADDIDRKMKIEKLRVLIPVFLDEREQQIIEMRYGLRGSPELTQRDIAKQLGISRSYVSRIETAALKKLRRQF